MAKPLALTSGEPAGIGLDITIEAWLRRDELKLPAFYLVGDRASVSKRARSSRTERSNSPTFSLGMRPLHSPTPCRWWPPAMPRRRGRASPMTAARTRPWPRSARRSPTSPPDGPSAVVTNPIAKSVLYRAGFRHPGHTEFLAELAASGGHTPQPVMMLWSPALAVVPVTIHLSLREAIAQLSSDLIVSTARIAVADLKARFGLANPRLAVSGLNPHAGEDGSLGLEDQTIVAPAIEILRGDGIEVRGPLPADTMFHAAARKTYDCAICMYHDQALIPIKTHGVRGRGQRHAGTAVHPHLAGSRHRVRHRRHRPRQSVEPDRGAAAGRPHGGGAAGMSAIDDLPPLRDVIRQHDLSARKSLGQNFLLDLNLTARIARAAGPLEDATVIEIGPGPGGLTRALLALGARRVIAVERDERALAPLEEIAQALSGPAGDRLRRRANVRSTAVARRRSARRSSPTCPTTSPPRC